jgi:hypothetical protein
VEVTPDTACNDTTEKVTLTGHVLSTAHHLSRKVTFIEIVMCYWTWWARSNETRSGIVLGEGVEAVRNSPHGLGVGNHIDVPADKSLPEPHFDCLLVICRVLSLGHNVVLFVESQQEFRRNMWPPSSGLRGKPSNEPV